MVNRVCLYITSSVSACLMGFPVSVETRQAKGVATGKPPAHLLCIGYTPAFSKRTHTQADRQTGRERQTHRRHSDTETVWVRDRPAEKKKRRVHSLVYIQGRTLHQCCKNKYLHSRVSLDKYQRDYFTYLNLCR